MAAPTLDQLRRYAIARTLFKPTTLKRAIARLGFVQADPIRAPARAQDLTLRHRVKDYRAGDLERRYPKLDIEEDCLVNYGFLPRETLALMHPREPKRAWDAETAARAQDLLAFIRERGVIHPREVLAAFSHGRVPGYWGGELNASTQLLDGMHYRGLLRVVRRDSGTRVYAVNEHPAVDDSPAARLERARRLVDLVVHKYAPLPSASLGYLVQLLGYGAPHLKPEARQALAKARAELPQTKIDGTTWLWPEGEDPASRRHQPDAALRLLAPFDPVVWDRRRFELFWGWAYKFEAYTPAAKRLMGHYALPLLWGEDVIGWANVRVQDGALVPDLGFIKSRPRSAAFRLALEEELARLHEFLDLPR
nr:crosslink repair DNA glycosylase YcaQ family protein [uncultured Roseateles sp.]